MLRPVSLLLAALSLAAETNAQCATAGYVPCLAPGTQSPVAPPSLTPSTVGGSGLWSSVAGAASDGIQRRDAFAISFTDDLLELEKRQNSLCCRPAPVECLHTGNIPFCYTPATTRVFFSDGSYGFLSNDTYYGADGTFIDYQNGIYQAPDGTVSHFTPGAQSSSSGGSSSSSTVSSSGAGTTATATSGAIFSSPSASSSISPASSSSPSSSSNPGSKSSASKTTGELSYVRFGLALLALAFLG